MMTDTYRILDKESIPDYLATLPAVMDVLGTGSSFEITEIGDGNLNFVYKVRNAADPTRSVILKQAVPYLRMVGEQWPLSRERMTFEIRALELHNTLAADRVPTIYHSDEDMSVLIIQCLDEHIILRRGMIDGVTYPALADHIGSFLANTLFPTSSLGMQSIARRELMARFVLNTELCKLTEDFIFTFPYMDHESNYCDGATRDWAITNVFNDSEYKLAVLELKGKFLSQTDALLHGDLHTGSLMVNATDTYVIDPEFAFFGPFGFDVGKIIANVLICCTAHYSLGGGSEYREWLLSLAFKIWRVFSSQFLDLWSAQGESAMLSQGLLDDDELSAYKSRMMLDILRDSVGFAGCSIARRTVGIAGNADIREIEPIPVRSQLEIANLQLSKLLISKYKIINGVDDFENIVRDFFADIQVNT